MYLSKNSKNKNPATDIINEVLCNYFLNIWGISTPDAAIINIDPNNLLAEYSKPNHKPRFYNKPVFGSKWIKGALDCNAFISINSKHDYDKFHNPEIIFDIGLFDIWIENDDRRATNTNLLLQTINGQYKILPIDHSLLFNGLTYKDLNPDIFCPIDNENIFRTDLAVSLKQYKKKKKDWQIYDEQKFYLCIENCKLNYPHIVKNIPVSWGFTLPLQNKLHDFLFNEKRNELVFREYLYKMR